MGFSSISYAREQYCDMLNAICLPTVKKAITEPYTIAYSFCKLRLQHVVNGNAAYTGHRWAYSPLDGGEVRQCIVHRNHSYTH